MVTCALRYIIILKLISYINLNTVCQSYCTMIYNSIYRLNSGVHILWAM